MLDTPRLLAGERNRVWLKLGEGDPDGPYELAFVNLATDLATAWAPAAADDHPQGGRGIYVWAVNGTAPGPAPTDTITLTRGMYSTRARHIDGYLVDVEQLGILEVE